MISKVILIGTGNVATNLGLQLIKSEFEIVGCYSRSKESTAALSEILGVKPIETLTYLPTHDLILVCVTDSAIASVVEQLPFNSIIAFTSGTVSLEELPKNKNTGVFYPLQTFTKNKIIDLKTVPFFVESHNKETECLLFELAEKIGLRAEIATSEQRKQLHISAVFVNNFTNHLAVIAKQHLEQHQLSWENLLPLLAETFSKIQENNPRDIQTGPARRHDLTVIEKHLKELSGSEKEIYKAITNSILHTYHA